jgi:hypothetical protein
MMQPNFTDPSYAAWIKGHYPARVAKLGAEPSALPRDDFRDDGAIELAARKRAIARVMFDGACRLMREADAIDAKVEVPA